MPRKNKIKSLKLFQYVQSFYKYFLTDKVFLEVEPSNEANRNLRTAVV